MGYDNDCFRTHMMRVNGNRYLRDFRSQVRSRFAEDSVNMPMSEWIIKNTRFKKKPFSYEGYEFQRQIVDDMHLNMSVIKCSQIGLTEVQARKFLGLLARTTALSGIFSLPDDIMAKRISTTRFKPLVDNEPVFNLGGVEKPVRRMDLIQINQSFGYLVGSKESSATSINADFIFNDEVDLTDQEMLALYNSRLQGSDMRVRQGFSTPTFEGFGIDASFQASDQHEYLVRCTRCRHHNIPLFTPDFMAIRGLSGDLNDLSELDEDAAARLDLGASYIRCEKCGGRLEMRDPSLREWVPRFPGRIGRGYRVSPFCLARLTPEYIVGQLLDYKKRDALRRFYNTVLGQAHNDSNARLSDADIKAVMVGGSVPEVTADRPVLVGIDVGITCHLVLMDIGGDRPVVFNWRQVLAENLEDEVKRITDTFNVVGGCIDRHPYTPLANSIRDQTNGLIMPVEYAGVPTAPAISFQKDELDNISHIRANRTTMIDTAAGAVRKRKVEFSGYTTYEALVLQHLKDMVRIEKTDEGAVWIKLTGNDHFYHALAQVFFAARVADALLYRSDADPRSVMDFSTVLIPMQNGSALGVQSRRRETISLGSLL